MASTSRTAGDGDPATSDGIFVFNGGNQDLVQLGDLVTVSGNVGENQGQTQVSVTATNVVECGTGTVEPAGITLPFASATDLEKYEGMLVTTTQPLYVTEHFQLGRFGQVVVSSGDRLEQPTNVVAPGAAAIALQAANNLNRLIVDDASQAQNPDPILFGRDGNPLTAQNTLRGGDVLTEAVGVMTYTWAGNSASGNAYRLRPVNALGATYDFEAANPRPSAPAAVGGDVIAASMNLLNYFNTFDGLPDNVDNCTLGVGGAAADCRGADTQAEFDRQWPKTVSAVAKVDADVIGVNEIENDGYGPDSAIAHLVDRLNDELGAGTYAYVDVDARTGQTNALGTDAIKVGMLYKPGVVTPVGDTAALNTVEFVNGGDGAPRSRPSLAQAFEVNATGGVFVADVNHLKSKGSACDVPDAGDGQGNCNDVRTAAARELATWLAADPTGTGDTDVLILGDLNSYAKEDPITTLQAAGYTNLVAEYLGPDAYSYVFDGQWGYLDHALASATMRTQVNGVAEYHINADEPSVLDYNTDFKTPNLQATLYAPDEFRVSDHDPVIVGLTPNSPATVTAAFDDASLSCARTARLTVGISDRDAGDTHAVRVDWGDGSTPTTVDRATSPVSLTHRYARAGRYTATVTVTDSHGHVTTTTAAIAVEYVSTGLIPRLGSSTKPLVVKRGSVVPVTIGYVDCTGRIPRDIAPVITVVLDGATVLEKRMNQIGPVWLHLLRTGSLPASTGTFTVTVTVPSTGQTDSGTLPPASLRDDAQRRGGPAGSPRRCRSGGDDHAPGCRAAGHALPRRGCAGEWHDVVADLEPAGGGVLEHGSEDLAAPGVREGGVGVAQHRGRPAAQGGRVDRQAGPGGAAEVDEAPAGAQHQRGGRARDAGQWVDDDVGRAAARVAEPLGERRGVLLVAQVDHGIRTVCRGALERGGVPRRGDDPPRTEQLGRLHGNLADDAPGAQHEHRLTGAQPGPTFEHLPRGHRRQPQGRHHGVGEVGLDDHGLGGRRDRQLGQPAVTGRHPGRGGEPHPAPDELRRPGAHHPDRLHPGHVGQRRSPEVGGAAGAEQVERGDRHGGDRNEQLVRPGHRVVAVDDLGWPAVRGQGCGAHRAQVAMSG